MQSTLPKGAIFTASRLDGPKRIDWIVQAYLRAGVSVPLVIAGDGPCRAALEEMASGHPHIHFAGRLTDSELAAAYQDALFVPFVPDREDYGLITLEALQAGKPVLTCLDSGGVTELVRHEVNGLITSPDIDALAAGMRRLVEDAPLRHALSAAARGSVAHIDWPALAIKFSTPWPKVVVVNTFPIYPAANGGQVRMLNLYQRLTHHADVTVVNLGPGSGAPIRRRLHGGLTEVVVPMTAEHTAFDIELGKTLRASCTDIAAMLKPELTPDWIDAIREACARADVVIACHPYVYPAIRQVWDGPVVYESLNVEADLKAAIFGHTPDMVGQVASIEAACAQEAALVLCCSTEDAVRMQALYRLHRLPSVVPNGVDAASYPTLAPTEIQSLKSVSAGRPLALFVASLHGPNIDALRDLMPIAEACPDILFGVVGSVCNAPDLPPPPANMILAGRVSDAELRTWLAAADVGLNPMSSGSGTNLKMLEYAAAGLPTISTPFGGRGGILEAGTHYIAAELQDFAAALKALIARRDDAESMEMIRLARERAATEGDWSSIAQRMWSAIADAGLLPHPTRRANVQPCVTS